MTPLKNRIDFAGIISVNNCNPNGDPLNGGVPRINFDGYGLMSDVCLKHKIRKRLKESGYGILIESNEFVTDGLYSISSRVKNAHIDSAKERNSFVRAVCEKWIDVRAFGQVFAYKGLNVCGSSVGIRGPVSIQYAQSIDIPLIETIQVAKCTNMSDPKNPEQKDRSTLGIKYIVDHGIYVFYGSIMPQLASLTGFSAEDAEAVKQAIVKMFYNDSSASRPAGSMVMEKVFWWTHNCPSGQYSPAKVHRSLSVIPLDDPPYYRIELNNLPNLDPEIIEGW